MLCVFEGAWLLQQTWIEIRKVFSIPHGLYALEGAPKEKGLGMQDAHWAQAASSWPRLKECDL